MSSRVVMGVLAGLLASTTLVVVTAEEAADEAADEAASETPGETRFEIPPLVTNPEGLFSMGAPEYRYITATRGQEVLFRYALRGARYKPYVQQFATPSGFNVLSDAPPDHPHHHGLMFAVGVDDVDFWAEKETPGRQVVRTVKEDVYENTGRLSITHVLDWFSGDNRTFLARENRVVILGADLVPNARVLVWQTQLAPPAGRDSIKLWGHHYFGFGMRLAEAMDKNGTFLAEGGSEGQVIRDDERLRPGKWCAYVAPVGGKHVTVAMFDHPLNERRALWFTMAKPFAYLAASLNLHQKPMTVKQGETLSLIYGVAAWDGQQSAETIQETYDGWLKAVIVDTTM